MNESTLTLEKVQEAVELIEAAGRRPVFVYCGFIDEIYHGTGIDDIASIVHPRFDPKFHKGYLIPEKYRKIAESFDDGGL